MYTMCIYGRKECPTHEFQAESSLFFFRLLYIHSTIFFSVVFVSFVFFFLSLFIFFFLFLGCVVLLALFCVQNVETHICQNETCVNSTETRIINEKKENNNRRKKKNNDTRNECV